MFPLEKKYLSICMSAVCVPTRDAWLAVATADSAVKPRIGRVT